MKFTNKQYENLKKNEKDKQKKERLHLIWDEAYDLPIMQLINSLALLVDEEWFNQCIDNQVRELEINDVEENLAIDFG